MVIECSSLPRESHARSCPGQRGPTMYPWDSRSGYPRDVYIEMHKIEVLFFLEMGNRIFTEKCD